ncbi:MAG: hypothetical protein IJM24_01970 [Clostridia bacterium]|nr:hypothetical protein [Clostridia bacterium]
MISKEVFRDAMSLIDKKYVKQAVQAETESPAKAGDNAAPEAAAAESVPDEPLPPRADNTPARRLRTPGLRQLLITAAVLVFCTVLGVVIAVNVRMRGRGSQPAGASDIAGSAPTPASSDGIAPVDPTPTPRPTVDPNAELFNRIMYDMDKFIEIVYDYSLDPLPKDGAALHTEAPGARTDVSDLRRAPEVFTGKTVMLKLTENDRSIFDSSDVFFVLHRDVINGEEANTGRIVIMVSEFAEKPYHSDTDHVFAGQYCLLIAGRTENVSNVVSQTDSGVIFFEGITIEQISIIDFFDMLYPRNAFIARTKLLDLSVDRVNASLLLNERPLFGYVSGEDGAAVKTRLVRRNTLGTISLVNDDAERPFLSVEMDDASRVNIDPLLLTYERFGLEYPADNGGDRALSYNVRSPEEYVKAFLRGYPEYKTARELFDSVGWLQRGVTWLGDGGVIYRYLSKLGDKVVIITTPVLYDSKAVGFIWKVGLSYYVTIDGQKYVLLPDSNLGFDDNDCEFPILVGDRIRSREADKEPFTVEVFPSSQYNSVAAELKDRSDAVEERRDVP